MADFDSWVARAVLNPASPLFREARYLLAEDPGLRDPTLYHSVLAAVAEGNTTRGGIAGYIGRKATDLQHPLTVLEDAGLLARDADPLRDGRSNYRITEPLCRTWVAESAAPETLGGIPATVGHGTVNDAAGRTSHEVDVVALGDPGAGPRPVLALGETKWGEQMGLSHLDRLRHIRSLLHRRPGITVTGTKLLCSTTECDPGWESPGRGLRHEAAQVDPTTAVSSVHRPASGITVGDDAAFPPGLRHPAKA